ncbi:hypothetical protein NPIL_361031, partial [Nephila pilipes]
CLRIAFEKQEPSKKLWNFQENAELDEKMPLLRLYCTLHKEQTQIYEEVPKYSRHSTSVN